MLVDDRITALEQQIAIFEAQVNDPSISEALKINLLQTIAARSANLSELYRQMERETVVSTESHRFERLLTFVAKEVTTQFRIRMDCWTPSRRTEDEQVEFKNSLKTFYQRTRTTDDFISCMVLDSFLPNNIVVASHIWKRSTHGVGLEEFGLNISHLQNPRNGLLLHKAIEEAFDNKRLCFLVDRLHQNRIIVRVLCPELSDVLISETVTFGAINGNQLQHPVTNLPFRRILDFHAKLSFRDAKARGWIPFTEDIESFFDLPIDESIPDLNLFDDEF